MKIRKLTILNEFSGQLKTRYDIIVADAQKFCVAESDEKARDIFNAMAGVKSQMKPFLGGGVIEEWIDL